MQERFGAQAAPATLLNFDGVGNGFTGPAGSFIVNSAPPDPNLAVGPIPSSTSSTPGFAVFDKSGTADLRAGGDQHPVERLRRGLRDEQRRRRRRVAYDQLADRWIIQPVRRLSSTPYLAVRRRLPPARSDRHLVPLLVLVRELFPDYPKLAVWPDAYYVDVQHVRRRRDDFKGGRVCALDRAADAGRRRSDPAVLQHEHELRRRFYRPSMAATRAPSGSPNYVVGLGATASNTLAYWKFHVDWTTPANTTFTGRPSLRSASYDEACAAAEPASRSRARRSSSTRSRIGVMYRLAYRNFGDHESLVVNHSVVAGSSTGSAGTSCGPMAVTT